VNLLRAFASGCTAMSGVEAANNGVQAFREPVSQVGGMPTKSFAVELLDERFVRADSVDVIELAELFQQG
jgi:hypothetical protein